MLENTMECYEHNVAVFAVDDTFFLSRLAPGKRDDGITAADSTEKVNI